jgi:hypothetical protein
LSFVLAHPVLTEPSNTVRVQKKIFRICIAENSLSFVLAHPLLTEPSTNGLLHAHFTKNKKV